MKGLNRIFIDILIVIIILSVIIIIHIIYNMSSYPFSTGGKRIVSKLQVEAKLL